MYRLVRNVHLILGLSCCLFLLMYGASAVQMSHNAWFESKPTVTESRLPADAAAVTSPRTLAASMMRMHGLRGDVQSASVEEGAYVVRIVRPGTVSEVRYTPGDAEAQVKTSRAGLMGMLNRLHQTNGLWHEYGLLNVWGVFVGLVSLTILFLGATGVYLWFEMHAERRIGGLILSLGLATGLGLLVAMRLQP